MRALVSAKGEWCRENSRRFDGNGLWERQEIVAIFCDGGQHLDGSCFGGSLLRLTWLCFDLRGFNRDNAIVIVGFVCLAQRFGVRLPLRDGASKNLEELACVRLAMKDCGLCQKWREEDGESLSEADEANDDDSVVTIEAAEVKAKPR